MRKGLKTLKQGGMVGILIDQRVGAQAGGHNIEFLGTPSKTSLAAGYLAAQASVPIYMTALQPIGGSRYRLVMNGPFRTRDGLAKREASIAIMTEASAALSAQIEAHPEAWAWWLRRWKHPRPYTAPAPVPATAVPRSLPVE